MISLDEAIAGLTAMRDRLSDPTVFYREHRLLWLSQAEEITVNLLNTLRPEGADAEEWSAVVADTASKIAALLLDEGETGLVIYIQDRHPQEGYVVPIDFETIVKWVEAGRAGHELGKHLMAMDDTKTDRAIAWRVMHALRLSKSEGLKRAIERFAASTGAGGVEMLAPTILQAWFEFFSVRAADDWRSWVAGIVGKG